MTYQITDAEVLEISTLVGLVNTIETTADANVRTHVLAIHEEDSPVSKLALKIRELLNNLGNANITPDIKKATGLDTLPSEAWAFLKLMTEPFAMDLIKRTIIADDYQDPKSKANKIIVCMSTSLSGQYQWTKKRAYGEGFKLNGKTLPPKKTPTPKPETGNDTDTDTETGDDETETPNRTVEEIVKNFYDFAGDTPMDILSDALTEIMELRAEKARALKTG
tara:strand:+ start:16634 stop:17299 length:666 start_codon:yes stop_codon:yes gene_type:complete